MLDSSLQPGNDACRQQATSRGDYSDNAYRFAFLSKASLVSLKALGYRPDIIHCNDWQTALIPFYMKHQFAGDDFYNGIKVLFTIHNMAYQGVFNKSVMRGAGIPTDLFTSDKLEFYGKLNFMKSGLILQVGTPAELEREPADEYVRELLRHRGESMA